MFVFMAAIGIEGTIVVSVLLMLLTLHLQPATETKLAASAAAAGKDVATFALEILEAHLAIEPQSLGHILRPIHEAIRESGISGAKLDSLFVKELATVRSERSAL